MAITRTGLTNIINRGNTTTVTISDHDGATCNCAFVFLFRMSAVSPTGITYGGENMTQLVTHLNANNHIHEIWGIQNPPTGVVDVEINYGGAVGNTIAGVASYRMSDSDATFPNVANSDNNLLSSLTVSVTTTLDNCVLLGIGSHVGLAADEHSPGTGTSRISLYSPGSGTDVGMLESSPFDTGTAGSKSLQITLAQTGQDMCLAVVAIAPSLSRPKLFRYV